MCDELRIPVGGKTVAQLKQHCADSGLDTAHIRTHRSAPRVRDLSDDALREAARAAGSWTAMVRLLGFSGSVTEELRSQLMNRLCDRGISTSHFVGRGVNPSMMRQRQVSPFARVPAASQLRRAAVGDAIAWFNARGHSVSIPIEPTAYDLVVDVDGKMYRVQVKSSTSERRIFSTSRTFYSQETGKPGSRAYKPGEIDYFFMVLIDGSKYVVPYDQVGESKQITMNTRFENYRV